tara:strand:- start:175 stop:354 length:180 start_codon:yes stop_codon:yes gene_type:complete
MADAPAASAVAPEAVRDELVERLKADLAAKTEESARLSARASIFEDKERARIKVTFTTV